MAPMPPHQARWLLTHAGRSLLGYALVDDDPRRLAAWLDASAVIRAAAVGGHTLAMAVRAGAPRVAAALCARYGARFDRAAHVQLVLATGCDARKLCCVGTIMQVSQRRAATTRARAGDGRALRLALLPEWPLEECCPACALARVITAALCPLPRHLGTPSASHAGVSAAGHGRRAAGRRVLRAARRERRRTQRGGRAAARGDGRAAQPQREATAWWRRGVTAAALSCRCRDARLGADGIGRAGAVPPHVAGGALVVYAATARLLHHGARRRLRPTAAGQHGGAALHEPRRRPQRRRRGQPLARWRRAAHARSCGGRPGPVRLGPRGTPGGAGGVHVAGRARQGRRRARRRTPPVVRGLQHDRGRVRLPG